jgi:hypothetical protein
MGVIRSAIEIEATILGLTNMLARGGTATDMATVFEAREELLWLHDMVRKIEDRQPLYRRRS